MIGALQGYRAKLCFAKKDKGPVFSRIDPEDQARTLHLTGAEYSNLDLELRYT